MAFNYQVDFTDGNPNRQFVVSPYTTNGPRSPTDPALSSGSTGAATSLLLYGKESPNYGERIAENLVNMLEHFAGDQEPVYPISGQVWYDRSVTPNQLRVFNQRKYQIIAINPTGGTITVSGTDPYLQTQTGRTITLSGPGVPSAEQFVKVVVGTASVVGSDTEIVVTPTPDLTHIGWYLGGWEYILQNNTPLRHDFDAGGFRIINLGDPTTGTDAANRDWVLQEIINASLTDATLNDLTDVTIVGPTANQILTYTGTQWINAPGSTLFVPITGGTMTGFLTLHADPTSGNHAATKNYVDSIAAVGGPVSLDDLTDVTIIGSPTQGSLVQYTPTGWQNVDLSSFIGSSGILTVNGGTITSPIYYTGTPVVGTELVNKDYVDSAITAGQDGVVTGGTFNPTTLTLTLNRSVGGPVIIPGFSGGSGGSTSVSISHNIDNPNNPAEFPTIPTGSMLETKYATTTTSVQLDEIIKEISTELGKWQAPRGRIVFTTNGSSTIYLGDTSGGAQPNQCNPTGALDFSYVVGSGNLQIYVNGQKYVASEHAYYKIGATQKFFTSRAESGTNVFIIDGNYVAYFTVGETFNINDGVNIGSFTTSALATYDSGANETTISVTTAVSDAGAGTMTKPNKKFGLWQGTSTGLNSGTTYTFRVNVNGAGDTIVSVLGSNATRVGNLITYLRVQSALNGWNFGVNAWGGDLYFYSNVPGVTSSIVITDGDGGSGTPLFANMNGGYSSTGGFVISLPGTTNPYPTATYGYDEVGQVAVASDTVVFTSTPPLTGSIIEVLIDRELY